LYTFYSSYISFLNFVPSVCMHMRNVNGILSLNSVCGEYVVTECTCVCVCVWFQTVQTEYMFMVTSDN